MPEHLDPRNDPDSGRGPESHPGGRGCGFWVTAVAPTLAAMVIGCAVSIAVSIIVVNALGW